MKEVPPDVDWIKERVECSVEHTFQALKARMERDIAEWTKSTGGEALLHKEASYRFGVSRKIDPMLALASWCRIETKEGHILASSQISPNAEIKEIKWIPRLTPQGECHLFSSETGEMLYWQVSMVLLEPILFR